MIDEENNSYTDNQNENRALDGEIDKVFKELKKEIIDKREPSKLNVKKEGYYCKLCGEFTTFRKEPIIKLRSCSHCHIPIDRHCRSCGYCLNCFLNLTDDAQKTLKLLKFLFWFIPIFSSPFLYFQGYLRFILTELFIIILFAGLYFYAKWYISSHTNRYFNNNWEDIIKNEQYKVYLDPDSRIRYLNAIIIEDGHKNIEKRKEKLKRWIEPEKELSKVPVPAYIEKKILKINEKEDFNSFNKKEIMHIKQNTKINEEEPMYKLKKCPKCSEEIKFANFCPSCNRKFCPECGIENTIYNRLCLCGFVFPELKDEFFKWAGTDEVEFLNKDNKEA
ncbi:hypothetical protein DSAG12_00722 [Promethearchaeum syntrophicum]|uniref:Double zinc ribbon n=1 Tax=Promethearchaeum syntrophicum TaxID=2594042 RepID=A0A5B9D7D7_9ARCH|nr:hypothetical protein [Candidatus Prometheoarchaeum syntrophicum]QEE14901.1 hypothetical protein DSAG12_00722 [Candidatus Prometheoarchaeum syntrophicum]